MRLLHYFLGFPPYRSGGLTKYAYDLMEAQVNDGNEVSALWPGKICILNHNVFIKKEKSIMGIVNYELINPLPVPLDEGIFEFDAYMKSCDKNVYLVFLNHLKPDAIHIHTLMGLHREFIDVAAELKIKTVFTTHDYFGICPKVTLYRYGDVCDDDHGCRDCIQCNCSGLSLRKIMFLQSPLYRNLKNSFVVRHVRKSHRGRFFSKEKMPETGNTSESAAHKYSELRAYYMCMLEKIDIIHFNSSIAEKVYTRYIVPKDSIIMTITHKNIREKNNTVNWKLSNKLRITFLSAAKPFKGFTLLKNALDELWEEGKRNFELHIYNPVSTKSPYMIIEETGFKQDELEEIFTNTDILVAPSIWYETFGFTVLEALSYGVPVIVSDNVGAKDIINDGGIIVKAGDLEELKRTLLSLSSETICTLRMKAEHTDIKGWNEFLKENYKLYIR